ncbi:MAG: tRNA 2-thiouridine(34) synthase MnmA [Patescibacteria group bacterium]
MARIWNKHKQINAPLKRKVFVAMSGGVDSSVAALLLKRQKYNVTGVFMRCYNLDGCAERDARDAQRVAAKIGIPFYVWDFEREYKKRVVKYMVDGYRKGITPNPDVMCNKEIKFGLFLKKALSLGADYVATGHYVRITRSPNKFAKSVSGATPKSYPSQTCLASLYVARDAKKDQSYFLWTLTQEQLQHCLFPIGGYTKPQVRAIAKKAGLGTAEKKDSQGICFLGDISLFDFLKKKIKAKKGAILTTDGIEIGEHEGAWFYTIGQRHGLNLNQKQGALNIHGNVKTKPHYVVAKDVKENIIVVAEGEENAALFQKNVKFTATLFSPAVAEPLRKKKTLSVFARVRYRQPLFPAKLKKNGKNIVLEFRKPQKFVAPGQSAVLYSKTGEVLGGGVIRL